MFLLHILYPKAAQKSNLAKITLSRRNPTRNLLTPLKPCYPTANFRPSFPISLFLGAMQEAEMFSVFSDFCHFCKSLFYGCLGFHFVAGDSDSDCISVTGIRVFMFEFDNNISILLQIRMTT